MSRKGTAAIVTWQGDWKCSCGSQNKLWDACACGQPSPCREWVRGNCSMPKCRFPHPPFKIPEHLQKPSDPIANPPAAAAKQKAVAQAHAAALAAERNPLCKEMAIVTWLGHWQCNCGKVHKLWDACKCGQQPPCREWVRGQCDLPKCRFPHPPFAIPGSLPKPDDPIANPTPEQLAIPLQMETHNAKQQDTGSPAAITTANGKAETGAQGSGGSTPVAVSSAASNGSEQGLSNPGIFGAVGQPVPANGLSAKQEAAQAAQPAPATTKPGISFRAALLAKAAAAAAAANELQDGVEVEAEQQNSLQEALAQSPQHAEQESGRASYTLSSLPQQHQVQAGDHVQMAGMQEELGPQHAQQQYVQQQQQQQQEGRQGSSQNGIMDPVVAAPASARSNQAAAAATAGGLGWNPMAKDMFAPLGPQASPRSADLPVAGASGSGGLASQMGSLQVNSSQEPQQGRQQPLASPQQHRQHLGGQQQAQQAGSLQLPPPPAPVATQPAPAQQPGIHAGQMMASPRMGAAGVQSGSAHMQAPSMSPKLGLQQQQQRQQPGSLAGLPGSVAAALSPRYMPSGLQAQQQQQQPGMSGVGATMSPRFMAAAGMGGARSSLLSGSMAQMGAGAGPGLKAGHLGGQYSNGMGLGGGIAGVGQSGGISNQASQQQYTLQAALQQMALQQQVHQQQQQQQQQQQSSMQQQKPAAVIARTLLEFGLMDPAFYHALRQVDFLPDGYYQQDTLTLEDQQRRMEMFNAAVDSYIAAGVDNRSMLEISCQAKLGLTGGPLYFRCATCGQAIPPEIRQHWCGACKVTPFCSQECHQRLFQQHRGVCSSMLTKPLLPSQIALRVALEIYAVHGLTGASLHQAVLRQTAAVQRSYAAAAAAATVAGVVDE